MIPGNFEYFTPTALNEALSLLQEHGDDAKVLAGGHSLIPTMKLRLAEPAVIIDIGRIGGLKGISESDGKLVIGALTTHHELESSDLVQQRVPLLAQTASEIGDVQVRNKGTIGGSLAHADPAADWPATILALDADLQIAGPNGERTVKATDFFQGLYETDLGDDEILTAIHVSIPDANTKGTYLKLHQVASGFALTGVAVVLTKSGETCQSVSVGITGVSDTPYRASGVESALTGSALTADNIAAAAARAADGITALEDIHASEAYRQNLAQVYTRRAIEAAAS
ncbi:xanthine dehydrogenase family protein subunit M [Candidatus Poribacteria bacterium]|nr:xanthine dehydrogenase family protein subunit M [Candidatus Poribacteria bacterium]